MKHNIVTTLVVILLLPAAAQAVSMSSPSFTSNAGRIASGGTASTDASGLTKSGIAIGQGVFIPAGGNSSPGYAAKTATTALAVEASLEVSTLPSGSVTASSSLTVTGRVFTDPLPRSVTVNGSAATVNPDGSYSVTLPLQSGTNTISISMIGQNGVTTTKTRTVTYDTLAAPVTVTTIASNSVIPPTQTSVPIGGSVGPAVVGVTVSVNGGVPQAVPVVNGAFNATSGTLATGLNTVVITATTSDGKSSSSVLSLWRSTIDGGANLLAHTGDVNGDGVVNIIDALLALKTGVGLVQLSSSELSRGDVGPLLNGVALGDGRIDIEDTILILRKAVGLSW